MFLLPGVELSVNDGANGIHTLVIFSDRWLETGYDYINPFLTAAFEGKAPAEYEDKNVRCSLGLLDTIKKLNTYNRDYFLFFAHVEQGSGLWKKLDGGRIGELGKNPLFRGCILAFQKVRTHEKGEVCRTKVQNWLKDWYPTEVEGSDCKSIDEIGSKFGETWLKIDDFTFEAIKYALLDYPDRVQIKNPEQYSHSYIKDITFEGGILKGHTITFSPELNTCIGIRGSGKSSILESIRDVLDIPFGEQALDQNYKNALILYTLGAEEKPL